MQSFGGERYLTLQGQDAAWASPPQGRAWLGSLAFESTACIEPESLLTCDQYDSSVFLYHLVMCFPYKMSVLVHTIFKMF